MNSKTLHLLLLDLRAQEKVPQNGIAVETMELSEGRAVPARAVADTGVGKQVRAILSHGELVSDEVIIPLLQARLAELAPNEGFLLDGFPRTPARALDEILADLNRPLNTVISLELGMAEAVNRLGGRRICHGNGPDEIIHISDEAAVARCIERGGLLVQRPDDLPNVIIRRLAVYHAQTEPLLGFYRPRRMSGTILTHQAQRKRSRVAFFHGDSRACRQLKMRMKLT